MPHVEAMLEADYVNRTADMIKDCLEGVERKVRALEASD
jgi:hypothetical protein